MSQTITAAQMKALVEKTTLALGNPASVARLRAATWKGSGVLYEGDRLSHFTAEWAIQLPYQNRIVAEVEQNGAVLQAISVMNADTGWEVMNGDSRAMDAEKLAENQGQFFVNWVLPMMPLTNERLQLQYAGESRLDDQMVFGIRVMREGYISPRLGYGSTGSNNDALWMKGLRLNVVVYGLCSQFQKRDDRWSVIQTKSFL